MPSDVKGNNDLLVPHAAGGRSRRSTRSTSPPAPTSSRPTLQRQRRSRRPTTALADLVLRDQLGPPRAWRARPPTRLATPDRPRFVAGALGPTNRTASISPDVERPRRRATSPSTSSPTPTSSRPAPARRRRRTCCWSRRSSTRSTPRPRSSRSRRLFDELRPPLAGHASPARSPTRSGRTLSGQTHRGVLGLRPPRPPARRRPQLRARRDATCAPTSPSSPRLADSFVSRYPNAGLPNALRRVRRDARRRWPRVLGEFADATASLNIVGGCCGTTPDAHRGDRRGGRRAVAAARRRRRREPVHAALAASSR